MIHLRAVALGVVLAVVFAACAQPPAAVVVWASNPPRGASIIDCPTSDCGPLFRAAAQLLWSGRAPVTRSRLGSPVCSPDGGRCARIGPIGGADVFEVVLDLADGSVAMFFVQCWASPTEAAIAWNGEWCQPLPNG